MNAIIISSISVQNSSSTCYSYNTSVDFHQSLKLVSGHFEKFACSMKRCRHILDITKNTGIECSFMFSKSVKLTLFMCVFI